MRCAAFSFFSRSLLNTFSMCIVCDWSVVESTAVVVFSFLVAKTMAKSMRGLGCYIFSMFVIVMSLCYLVFIISFHKAIINEPTQLICISRN